MTTCQQCNQDFLAEEFVAQNSRVMPWCLRCRRLWSAERNGIRCVDCGAAFIRTSKRDHYCLPCRKVREELPVERIAARVGSLLNPKVDPEAGRRWQEIQREWAETHGVGTWT